MQEHRRVMGGLARRLPVDVHGSLPHQRSNAAKQQARESDSAPAHQQPDYQYDQQKAANATSNYGSAIIVATATAQDKQQDQDDQDKVHMLFSLSKSGAKSHQARHFWKLRHGNPEVLDRFNHGSERAQAPRLLYVAVGMASIRCMDVRIRIGRRKYENRDLSESLMLLQPSQDLIAADFRQIPVEQYKIRQWFLY